VWYWRALDRLSNSDNDAYGRIRTRLLARVLARKPADPEVWLERGRAYGDLREWQAAAADFAQAIRRKPADPEARLTRGRAYAEMGRWDRAADDLAKEIDLRREATNEDWQIGYEHALARLGAGDLAGYRAARARFLSRFGKSDDPDIAWGLATVCAAAPGAVPDAARTVRLAEKAVAGENKAFGPFWHYRATLALALYRAGQNVAAIRQARESIAASPEGDCGANWLLLAMAHYRLGHADQARRWLAKGLGWRPDASRPWHERLRFELLRREAQALCLSLLDSAR
jgi:tetratricopeptide (TPR) repeat protein